MPSRKNLVIAGFAIAAIRSAAAAFGAEFVASCPVGSTLVQGLLESDRSLERDENLRLWEQAADCEWHAISEEAGDRAISQFHDVAHDNGLAGGLRTFARNGDFRLYVQDIKPMPLAQANTYLNRQPLLGTWRDSARGRSADSTSLFAVGEVSLHNGANYRYAEVWQFDPKVANWGVRLLLLMPSAKK